MLTLDQLRELIQRARASNCKHACGLPEELAQALDTIITSTTTAPPAATPPALDMTTRMSSGEDLRRVTPTTLCSRCGAPLDFISAGGKCLPCHDAQHGAKHVASCTMPSGRTTYGHGATPLDAAHDLFTRIRRWASFDAGHEVKPSAAEPILGPACLRSLAAAAAEEALLPGEDVLRAMPMDGIGDAMSAYVAAKERGWNPTWRMKAAIAAWSRRAQPGAGAVEEAVSAPVAAVPPQSPESLIERLLMSAAFHRALDACDGTALLMEAAASTLAHVLHERDEARRGTK